MNTIHSTRTLAHALFTLVLVAAPSAALPFVSPDDDTKAISLTLLDRGYLRPDRDEARIAQRLTALGAGAVPELLSVLGASRVPVETNRGDLYKRLEPWQKRVVRAALLAAPHEALITAFEKIAESGDPEQRVLALGLLSEVGRRSDLHLLPALGSPSEDSARVPRPLRTAFDSTLTAIAKREPRTIAGLDELFGTVHPSHVAAVIRCAGSVPGEESFQALGAMLGRVPEADSLVLVELGRVGPTLPRPLDEFVLSGARRYLASEDPSLAVEAVVVAGRLQDDGAVPHLVRLLGGTNNLRKQALGSLRTITGQRMGLDPAAWQRWYEAEQRWWNGDASRLLNDLDSADVEVAAEAALELARHRLYRADIRPELERRLASPSPVLVRIACAGLGHFGDPGSVPLLLPLLDSENAGVRQESLRALQRITGERLPAEREVWKQALAGRAGFPPLDD